MDKMHLVDKDMVELLCTGQKVPILLIQRQTYVSSDSQVAASKFSGSEKD